MGKYKDLIGMKFGKLAVMERTENYISRSGRKYTQYLCKCDCGRTFVAYSQMLLDGRTWQCGCETGHYMPRGEDRHGDASPTAPGHRLYALWCGIKRRCYYPKIPGYSDYGGRGIRMCDEWLNDYKAFRTWAIENGYDINVPRGECTIDRIDIDGDYSPENCRFVDIATQNDNKSNVIHVEYHGETHNLKQWAEIFGINYTTLQNRYHCGYTGDKLFSKEKLPKPTKEFWRKKNGKLLCV